MKEVLEISCSDANNWKVGKHYLQTLPKALVFAGQDDEKLLQTYNESLEAFKRVNTVEPTGAKKEFKIERESGSPLFGRDKERLFLLAFETLLKQFVAAGFSIAGSLENIRDGVKLERKTFGKKDKR